jgi:hypothetical protein
MEEQMTMTFDQPGKKGSAFEIEDDGAGRHFDQTGCSGRFNEWSVYQHQPAFMHLFAVKDPVGAKQIKSVRGGRLPGSMYRSVCMWVGRARRRMWVGLPGESKEGGQQKAGQGIDDISHAFRFWR